jgi:hypothetical protein
MEQKHFTAIVIGDNHQEIMEKYDSNLKITPYVAMQFKDSKQLYETELKFLETLLANNSDALSEEGKDWIKFELETLKNTDHIDYYISKADRMGYTIDQETGNAFCDKNPHGYYDYCRIGKDLSLPLITFNNEEVYSARKKDVDFSKLHQYNTLPYIVAWETVMEGREPKNEEERRIYDNMKNRIAYFENFKDKETYIAWSTSFWGYAFVNDKEWIDIDNYKNHNQIEWVTNFYDRFIKDLPEDTLITVYECVKN